jgi:hypothetical protein
MHALHAAHAAEFELEVCTAHQLAPPSASVMLPTWMTVSSSARQAVIVEFWCASAEDHVRAADNDLCRHRQLII